MIMITITDKALAKLKDHISSDPYAIGVRVGVRGGGCSGFQYLLEIVEQEEPEDKKIDYPGVTIYIDKKSSLFLAGTEIDYTEDLLQSGFKFNNPSASRNCGCGESFGV